MARRQQGKPIMAGSVPHGVNEPSYISMYRGHSIWSYRDKENALRLVMFDKEDNVRHGTMEALRALKKENMEGMYNLEMVREIG